MRRYQRILSRLVSSLWAGALSFHALAAFAVPDAPAPTTSAKVTRDLLYKKGGDPKLNVLDIYSPPGKTNCPVVIFIHGGGWQIGDKKSGSKGKAEAFPQQGYVFISINYRLAPKVQHPALVQDCAAAIAWVRNNVAAYGGDPSTLFVMGHSAGAHLAALVSTDERYLQAEGLSLGNLKGVVLLDGGSYDMTGKGFKKPSKVEPITNAFGSDPAVWKAASPVYHIRPGKGIPPFEILYVSHRPDSKSQSEELARALTGAKVRAEVKPAHNKTHETLNKELGMPGDVPTQQVYAFFSGITGQPVRPIAAAPGGLPDKATPSAAGKPRNGFQRLQALDLTAAQKTQVRAILEKYQGDRRNPAFRKEIAQVLTPEQRGRYAGNQP
ncbi:MAG: alpha/beta hydrolase fold domain-containing protein [Cytophagales bacterium]|nr:alpha/beta hydrolase fold domain-containing protein [Armatimonadota bacterium]